MLPRSLALVLVSIPLAHSARAANDATPRGAVVEEVHNDGAGFMVRVDVDRASRIYHKGDQLVVTVQSEKPGYLYLLYFSADDKITILFPNRLHRDNQIPAAQPVHIPSSVSPSFRIRIGAPYGQEVVKAIVTSQPIQTLDAKAVANPSPQVEYETVKSVFVRQRRTGKSAIGEHEVEIKTRELREVAVKPRVRRVGIFVGVSQYLDPQIRPLRVCHRDADAMYRAMKQGMDEVFLLVNEEVTLEVVEGLIRRKLPQLTKPGDEVFIYWSGHGGRCRDVSGDEADGMDEYLVANDSVHGQDHTMILDDQFGRWIQTLDGRKVVLILDTCHSAGQASAEHDFAKVLMDPTSKGPGNDVEDFLSGELARAKDVGQTDTALLASSGAAQVSFERREGDLSAMTFFLKELLGQQRDVSVFAAHHYVARRVPGYVAARFPGATQQPILINNLSSEVLLRRQEPTE